MPLEPLTPVRRAQSLRGIRPRYQVFDRRESPPMSVARLYRDPRRDGLVVFEVYDDLFREFLKHEQPFAGKRYAWVIDVDAQAPHDTRVAIVRPHPDPATAIRGAEGDPPLDLDAAVAAIHATGYYRVIHTSEPV